MEQDNIEYLSGEVKEILSSPPSWVATSGLLFLVGAVGLIILVGGLFKYPEIVTGDVVITTETPTIAVVAQKSDNISELKIADKAMVNAGELLLVFPSETKYKDVLVLEKDLETIGQLDIEKLRNYSPNRNLNIGELSQAYASFITAFELVPLTAAGDIDYATVVAVENASAQYERQLKSLEASLPGLEAEVKAFIAEKKVAADVYGDKMDSISLQKIFTINTKMTNKQSEITKTVAKIEEIKGLISNSNIRKLQAQTQAKAGAGDAIIHLNEKLDDLKKAVKTWKDNFLVIAPADGQVRFYADLKVGQFVNNGDILFNILPENKGGYVGKVKLPVDKSSKVKEGQDVNIKFGRYPFREYGTVRSKVSKVYPVAKDNAFYADIVIKNDLVTTLNRKLEYYHQMSGKAEIITDDKTFISKLFEKFTAIF